MSISLVEHQPSWPMHQNQSINQLPKTKPSVFHLPTVCLFIISICSTNATWQQRSVLSANPLKCSRISTLDLMVSEWEGSDWHRVLPGLDVVKQVLPAVVDVLQLVIDLRLFGLVAGRDELLSELLQMGLVLAEQVDLFHTVLRKKHERANRINTKWQMAKVKELKMSKT